MRLLPVAGWSWDICLSPGGHGTSALACRWNRRGPSPVPGCRWKSKLRCHSRLSSLLVAPPSSLLHRLPRSGCRGQAESSVPPSSYISCLFYLADSFTRLHFWTFLEFDWSAWGVFHSTALDARLGCFTNFSH